MTKEDKIRVIDTVIGMLCTGKSAKEIAEALSVDEAAVRHIKSRLEITHA